MADIISREHMETMIEALYRFAAKTDETITELHTATDTCFGVLGENDVACSTILGFERGVEKDYLKLAKEAGRIAKLMEQELTDYLERERLDTDY